MATSDAKIAACSWVELTNVVARLLPFHSTEDPATNPDPFSVSVEPEAPGVAVMGVRGCCREGTAADRLKPVPVRLAGIGETEDAVKATLTVAVKVPADAGVKTTLMAQLPPTGIEAQLLVCEKSEGFAPWMVIAETCRALAPTFERVISCEGLEFPAVSLGNVTLDGVRLATVQMPVNVTDCGVPAALSITETVPVMVPLAAGLKVTEIVQLAPAARLDGQLLVSA